MSGKSSAQKTSSAVSSGVKVSTHSSTTTTTRRTIPVNNTAKIQEIEDDEDEEDEEDSDYGDSDSSESDIDEIPDPEKWRIIKESGIIEQVGASEKYRQDTPIDDSDRDYIFEGIFFSIPTTCLFIVMDILVHRQYAETYTGIQVVQKALKIFPAILIMVYFSNKFKTSKFAQGAMFVVSVICGCYFLHTMYRSPAMGIMLRAPGIITILVYCIVQLQLIPAVISLAICGLYYEFGNVKYH